MFLRQQFHVSADIAGAEFDGFSEVFVLRCVEAGALSESRFPCGFEISLNPHDKALAADLARAINDTIAKHRAANPRVKEAAE